MDTHLNLGGVMFNKAQRPENTRSSRLRKDPRRPDTIARTIGFGISA